MSSRERLLTAMSCGQPDRVPLHFRLFGFVPPEHFRWSDEFEAFQRWAGIGVDDILNLGAPSDMHPDVRVRSWREAPTAD